MRWEHKALCVVQFIILECGKVGIDIALKVIMVSK